MGVYFSEEEALRFQCFDYFFYERVSDLRAVQTETERDKVTHSDQRRKQMERFNFSIAAPPDWRALPFSDALGDGMRHSRLPLLQKEPTSVLVYPSHTERTHHFCVWRKKKSSNWNIIKGFHILVGTTEQHQAHLRRLAGTGSWGSNVFFRGSSDVICQVFGTPARIDQHPTTATGRGGLAVQHLGVASARCFCSRVATAASTRNVLVLSPFSSLVSLSLLSFVPNVISFRGEMKKKKDPFLLSLSLSFFLFADLQKCLMGGRFDFASLRILILPWTNSSRGFVEGKGAWGVREVWNQALIAPVFVFNWLLKIMVQRRVLDAGSLERLGLFSQDDTNWRDPVTECVWPSLVTPPSWVVELKWEWDFFFFRSLRELTPLVGLCYKDFHVALNHSSFRKNERNKNGQRNSISDPAKLCQTTAHSSSDESLNHTRKVKGVPARCHKDLQPCRDLAPAGGGSPVCCFHKMNRQIFGECGALGTLNPLTHTHTLLQYKLHSPKVQWNFHNTHTPVYISGHLLPLPHPQLCLPSVCFMPLLCSLSQILQYLCVQQYFNKEYQN